MKNCTIKCFVFLFSLAMLNLISGGADMHAQTKKNRARLNVDYVKVIGGEHYLNLKASARIDRQTVEVSGIELIIQEVLDDEEKELGRTITNSAGRGKFIIDDFNSLQADSTGTYHIQVSFEGNDSFKKASKEISFRDADIKVEWVQKDSLNSIQGQLIDTHLDSTVAGIPLGVRVKRLFRPLTIGKDSYKTDEKGTIEVDVEDGIPGLDGVLDIEVVLSESDDYGTVIGTVKAPIGSLIADESTFDQRTMWSPRGKTPLFLLGLTYSFIFVVWGIFLYLFINLVRITKS